LLLGVVGSTNMNAHSSRSHAIFSITVESSEEGDDGQQHVKMGKLHLVDLAVSCFSIVTQIILLDCIIVAQNMHGTNAILQ
jgi:hypothetical protein